VRTLGITQFSLFLAHCGHDGHGVVAAHGLLYRVHIARLDLVQALAVALLQFLALLLRLACRLRYLLGAVPFDLAQALGILALDVGQPLLPVAGHIHPLPGQPPISVLDLPLTTK